MSKHKHFTFKHRRPTVIQTQAKTIQLEKEVQPPKTPIKSATLSPSFFTKSRLRSRYKENYSAALELPFSVDQLDQHKHNPAAITALVNQFIIEHAKRRVDLFFLTLIGYYNSKALPIAAHTHLQHGRGRNGAHEVSITQACHSSMTPGLADLGMQSSQQLTVAVLIEYIHP